MPSSTQFHAALILLHRPFISYSQDHRDTTRAEPASSEDARNPEFDRLVSRSVCASSAKSISSIFAEYRRRFDMAQVFGTGVQHAGTAATALMGEINLQTEPGERAALVESLDSLRTTMARMSKNYQPAVLMTSVVDQFIRDVKAGAGYQANVSSSLFEKREENSAVVAPTGTGVRLAADRVPEYDVTGGVGSHKRARVDRSYIFTPTGPGTASPQGLPFLPSSFFEGLEMDDMSFLDMGAQQDFGFSWDTNPGV